LDGRSWWVNSIRCPLQLADGMAASWIQPQDHDSEGALKH
jgi:hypothetical protein